MATPHEAQALKRAGCGTPVAGLSQDSPSCVGGDKAPGRHPHMQSSTAVCRLCGQAHIVKRNNRRDVPLVVTRKLVVTSATLVVTSATAPISDALLKSILVANSVLVTTSKAPVTTSEALVPNSFLLLLVRHSCSMWRSILCVLFVGHPLVLSQAQSDLVGFTEMSSQRAPEEAKSEKKVLRRNRCIATSNRCLTGSNKCHAISNKGLTTRNKNAISNKCIASSNKCLTRPYP